MQASRTWEPPGGTLGRILDDTRRRLASSLDGGAPRLEAAPTHPSFRQALRRETVAIIAELKRRSPSKGTINDALDSSQAVRFEEGGAAAISVLTEPSYFGGSSDDLVAVRAAVALPLLRKDFHVHPSQLAEAVAAGASAVLLIARALSPEELPRMVSAARSLGLEPLVEVRTESELERALEGGADIVGVNSRDLETLEVDERVPERLLPAIPADVIGIWESGVATVDDVRRAADAGADAVLVGSALSRSGDPRRLVRELSTVPRKPRAR